MLKEQWAKKRNVIADRWAKMTSRPGLGQRTGKEQIVDKAWITPDGKLEHHGPAVTHQEWAIRFLRETKDPASKTPAGQSLVKVDPILLDRGWIRVQVYSNDGLGLQGSDEAIKARGHVALQLVKPKRVYVMVYPDNETTMYLPDQLAEIGLGK
jgi:hypothetical protein